MADVFKDFVKSINETKVNVIDEDPTAERDYVPFVVNRNFSYFPDSVLHANELNALPHADHKLQYDALLNSIRAKKRFTRWLKPEANKDLDAIKEYYGYSNQRAREALAILTGEQLSFIHEKLDKGGIKNGRRRSAKGGAG
jgi:hypothetical protein